MNKKIAMSAMSIFSALAVVGGTTFALFDDSATQTNNTFATGNADLQIAVDTGSGPGDFGESILGPNFTGIFPGETRQFEFWLKNNSSSEIDLDLTADVLGVEPIPDEVQTIDNILLISWVCDTSGNGGLEETPTAEFSPRDWLNGGSAAIGTLEPDEEMICRMFGELPSSADNSIAGDTVEFDVEYGATQVVPSPSPTATPET